MQKRKLQCGILIGFIILQITMFHCNFSIGIDNESLDLSEGNTIVNQYTIMKIKAEDAGEILTDEDEIVNDINLISNQLYINELMADNDVTITSPNGTYEDWIELYNAGSIALNLSDLYLTDDLDTPMLWQFPNTTVINPGDYLLIWADGSVAEDILHLPFKLDANGDFIAIIAADGKTIIDSVSFQKQLRDISYGRTSDGGEKWDYLSSPSPGSTNNIEKTEYNLAPWIMVTLIVFTAILLLGIIFSNKLKIKERVMK